MGNGVADSPYLMEKTMKILQINGSARREGANSTRVADAIVARLKAKNPAATVVRRDLASNPCPLLDEAASARCSPRPTNVPRNRPPAWR